MKMSIGVWRETEMGWGLNEGGRKSLAMRDGNLRMLVLEVSVKCVTHMMTLLRFCSLYYKLLKTYWRWNVSPFSLLFGFTKLAHFWVISGWFYVWDVIPNGKILTVWYLRRERFFPTRKSSKLTLSARLGHLKWHFGLPTGNFSIYTWPANVAAIFKGVNIWIEPDCEVKFDW